MKFSNEKIVILEFQKLIKGDEPKLMLRSGIVDFTGFEVSDYPEVFVSSR